jgi:hypothetical protein
MSDSIDTRQELARTAEDIQKSQKELCAAFKAQMTKEVMDNVTAYASSRAALVENATGMHDPGRVEDLIQGAIVDTLDCVVTWDPKRIPLAVHMRQVIRSRTSHELERAEDRRYVALGQVSEDELSNGMETIAEMEIAANEADMTATLADFVARLRVLAEGDDAVLALIDCYCEGVTERRDVCRAARMTSSTYHNGRRRLLRLVEKLPHNLILAVKAAWV